MSIIPMLSFQKKNSSPEMSFPEVSIISPVYNVQQFLPAFFRSVVNQSFTNWELIMVNDGSTDESGKLCCDFAKTDERVKVFSKDNGGVSSARNLGLTKAKGTFVYFADPDDELLPDCLKTLVGNMGECIDLVSASHEYYYNSNLVPKKIILKDQDIITYTCDTFLEGITSINKPRHLERYLFTKLFRKSIIDGASIEFREDLAYREDVVFLFNYSVNCKHTIVGIDEDVYRYFRRFTGAAMRLANNYSEHIFDAFFSLTDCNDLMNSYGMSKVKKNLTREILHSYLSIIQIVLKSGNWRESKEFRHQMNVYLREKLRFEDVVSEIIKRVLRPFFH